MRKIIALGIMLLFLGMSISSTGFNLEKQSTICKSNNPPYEPSNPIPPDGATNVPLNSCVSCTGGDPDGDLVIYDIYFGKTTPPHKVISNSSMAIYCPPTMEFNTTYYWKVVAWDEHGASTEGPIWSFTTIGDFNGNTFYVGGTGEGNYTKIQDAIDNASDGDTVFVYDDSSPYNENLYINKSINLIGEDRDTTIISGPNTGIWIAHTNNVKIQSFTIMDGINNLIEVSGSSNCTFYNNIIQNDDFRNGVWCRDSSDIKIIQNYIKCGFINIEIIDCRNCILKNNNICGYENGYKLSIGIFMYESRNIEVIRNNITTCGGGIELIYSKPVFVKENNFIKNDLDALFDHWRRFRINWDSNYWGGVRKFPKIIFGYISITHDTILNPGISFLWANFDWHPAKEPYDIEV